MSRWTDFLRPSDKDRFARSPIITRGFPFLRDTRDRQPSRPSGDAENSGTANRVSADRFSRTDAPFGPRPIGAISAS